MTAPAGFGVTAGSHTNTQSRNTKVSGSTADLQNEQGEIVNQVVHSVAKEVTETYFCDNKETAEALVASLQSGNSVVTNVDIAETNTDFCKATVTTRVLPTAGASTGGDATE